MKKVWMIVNDASLENSDGCWYVSTSISPSSLTNASKIAGRREMKTTSSRGASRARRAENHSYLSTGSFRKGSSPVSALTLDSEATKLTGMVQKMHSATVRIRLASSPTIIYATANAAEDKVREYLRPQRLHSRNRKTLTLLTRVGLADVLPTNDARCESKTESGDRTFCAQTLSP